MAEILTLKDRENNFNSMSRITLSPEVRELSSLYIYIFCEAVSCTHLYIKHSYQI